MQRLPDPHLTPQRAPFASSLTPTVSRRRSRGRFEASPRRAAPKGHQSLISHTAPRSATLLHQATSRARGTPAFFRNSFSIFSSRVSRSSSRSRARSLTVSGGSSPACSRPATPPPPLRGPPFFLRHLFPPPRPLAPPLDPAPPRALAPASPRLSAAIPGGVAPPPVAGGPFVTPGLFPPPGRGGGFSRREHAGEEPPLT